MKHFNDILKICGKEDLSLAQFLSNAVLLAPHERVVDVDRVKIMLSRVKTRIPESVCDEHFEYHWNGLMKELGLK